MQTATIQSVFGFNAQRQDQNPISSSLETSIVLPFERLDIYIYIYIIVRGDCVMMFLIVFSEAILALKIFSQWLVSLRFFPSVTAV